MLKPPRNVALNWRKSSIGSLSINLRTNVTNRPAAAPLSVTSTRHDYCFLANVYLPRVWWMPGAIEQLAKGEKIEPLYERTIDEQRANDLFRWLGDFGPRFGWRQTGTPTKLQEVANLGGIGIIVAR